MTFQKLGRYEIVEELGTGGFGAVFKAQDTDLDRLVAVKILHPYLVGQPGFIARFHREARAAAGLEHPHIVPIYEVGEAEGRHFIVMRYLEGQTLSTLLGEHHGPLSLQRTLIILKDVASALDHAHSRGIIHRDVKPSNIFVMPTGAVLADFGIVRVLQDVSRMTATGQALGTPEYMAPEQIRGEAMFPCTDVYALGVVAYEMLTGQVPFTGATPFAIQEGHVRRSFTAPHSVNPQLPAAVNEVFNHALAKAPPARYQHAGDLIQALQQTIEVSRDTSRSGALTASTAASPGSRTRSGPQGAPQRPVTQPPPGLQPTKRIQRSAPSRPQQPNYSRGEASGQQRPVASKQHHTAPSNARPAQAVPAKLTQGTPGSSIPEKQDRTALVLGVLGVMLGLAGVCAGGVSPLFPAIPAAPGLLLGIWGLVKAQRSQNARAAKSWSIIAIVMNMIILLLSCVFWCILLLDSL